MNRPAHIWIAFALSLAVVFAALAWVSVAAVRSERSEARAQALAALEENARLALWRVDSQVAALVAVEVARPYFAYSPFYRAEGAYPHMVAEFERGELLIPSELLSERTPFVVLHFQIGPDGEVTSPQVPFGRMRELALEYVGEDRIAEAEQRLDEFSAAVAAPALAADLPPVDPRIVRPIEACASDAEMAAQSQPAQVTLIPPQQSQVLQQGEQTWTEAQQARSGKEFQARAQVYSNFNEANRLWNGIPQAAQGNKVPLPNQVLAGVLKPVWREGRLLLARRVRTSAQEFVQGCWLDWPALATALKAQIADLLPAATLLPCASEAAPGVERRMAVLPVRLDPGPLPPLAAGVSPPLVLTLASAWLGVLVAGTAVGVFLAGTLALSERRGAFVSAVTHELRTPLTTFRLYTELLASGLVADPNKRREYLDTLRVEAGRLSHLVENVLAYARLERGRAQRRRETLPLPELMERAKGRLAERAAQAGLALHVDCTAASATQVEADASAVEQVLFNLVDNACKYAADAEERAIDIRAENGAAAARIRVQDHGPGIAPGDRRRLFQPFHKSARQAAHSKPGVGLGLALSRRLAREMGGELRLIDHSAAGACFELELPARPTNGARSN